MRSKCEYLMRFNFWQKHRPIRSSIALLSAAALFLTCVFWVRSYWVGDEAGFYMTYQSVQLSSDSGAVFWLSITNYPVAGKKWFYRGYHGNPEHVWSFATGMGPTTCWYRFPNSDYHEPLFEYARGSYKNAFTGAQPTQMRYTSARLPHWALATLFALLAALGLSKSCLARPAGHGFDTKPT